MAEGTNSPEIKLTRREFLNRTRKVVATAVGASVASPFLAKAGQAIVNEVTSSETDKLTQNGFADFVPLFNAYKDITDNYKYYPQYRLDTWARFDYDLYNIVRIGSYRTGLMRDNDEQQTLNRAKDGWGDEIEARVQKAVEKAQSMPITIEEGLADTEEEVRQAYLLLAKVLPAHILMGPDTLHIIPGGGYYDGLEKDQQGKHRDSTLAVESLAHDREGFFRSALHELSHAEINWLDAKPFVTKKDFAEYLTLQLREIKGTMDEYFSLPWDQARMYKDGKDPLVLRYPGDWNLAAIETFENQLAKYYGINVNAMGELDRDERQDESLRFNRYLWCIGYTQKHLQEKPEKQRTQKEKNFLTWNSTSYDSLKRVFDELDHYFRGPVQREQLGLPGKDIPPNRPENSLNQANMRIQMARLRTLSALPSDKLTDFTTASQALRDAFLLG